MYKKIIKVVGNLVGAFGFDDSQCLESDSHLLHYPDIMRASLCVPLGISPCSSEESGKKKKKPKHGFHSFLLIFLLTSFTSDVKTTFFLQVEERNARAQNHQNPLPKTMKELSHLPENLISQVCPHSFSV